MALQTEARSGGLITAVRREELSNTDRRRDAVYVAVAQRRGVVCKHAHCDRRVRMGGIAQGETETAADIIIETDFSGFDELHQGKDCELLGDRGDAKACVTIV